MILTAAELRGIREERLLDYHGLPHDDLALVLEALERVQRAAAPFEKFRQAFDGKQSSLAQEDEDAVYVFNGVPITLGMLRKLGQALRDTGWEVTDGKD